MAFFINGLTSTIHGIALPFFLAKFSLSFSRASILFLASSLGFLLASFLFPFLTKRLTIKELLTIGLLFLAASSALIPLMPLWTLVVLASFGGGLGMGVIDVGFNTVIASLEPRRSQVIMNWLHFFFGFGALSGPLLLSRLLERGVSWMVLYLSTSFLILISFFSWRGLKPPSASLHQVSSFRPSAQVYSQIRFWALFFITLIYVTAEVGLMGWIPTLLTTLEVKPARAGLGISVLWAGITLGRAISTQLLPKLSLKRPLSFLLIGAGISTLFLVFTQSVWLIFVVLIFIGLFFSAIFPLAILQGSSHFPTAVAQVTSNLIVAGSLGALAGPGLLGWVGEFYSLQTGIAILACLLFTAVFLTALLPVQEPISKSEESDLVKGT